MRHILVVALFVLFSTATHNALARDAYGAIAYAYNMHESQYGYAAHYSSRAGAQNAAVAACASKLRYTSSTC